MIARRRLNLKLEGAAQDDLEDIQARAPEALGFALSAINQALRTPLKMAPKSKRLDGRRSLSFPAGPGDEKQRGRMIAEIVGNTLVIVAVDEDHDRAYAKARARTRRR